MTWKLYALVSAGAFVATYLVSSPAKDVARPAAPATARSTQKPGAGADIEQLAEGLHVRLRTDDYRTPGRDLFHFQSRPVNAVAANPAPRPVVEAFVPPPPPPLPPLTLSGVASDIVDGAPRRSAVLSTPANVFIVREGESVAGLYKVLSIGENSVELEALADGSHRSLRLSGR